MGKRHYILQGNTGGTAPYIKCVNGPCCGAICTTYLLGEYLNSEDQTNENEDDSKREGKIYEQCWDFVQFRDASNPLKIWTYLKEEEYKNAIEAGDKSVENNLPNGLCVRPVVELDGKELNNHPLFSLMDPMKGDARMPDLNLNDYTYSDIQLKNDEYLLGVFGPKDNSVLDASQYHYILLHREGNKLEYINPHENTWETWKEFTDESILESNFLLESNLGLKEKWWWKDFGLIIKKNAE